MHAGTHVCMYVFDSGFLSVCLDVCLYVFMPVCLYVCMCVCVLCVRGLGSPDSNLGLVVGRTVANPGNGDLVSHLYCLCNTFARACGGCSMTFNPLRCCAAPGPLRTLLACWLVSWNSAPSVSASMTYDSWIPHNDDNRRAG